MEFLTRLYVSVREFNKRLSKGQTMTEYALILAAVAVVERGVRSAHLHHLLHKHRRRVVNLFTGHHTITWSASF